MNKALEGNTEEILVTKLLNKKDQLWEKLPFDIRSTYAIHITSKKFATINQQKIKPKADIYFASGIIENHILNRRKYYLTEEDVVEFNLKPIPNSGLSVKMSHSKYTITKISPNTFLKLFKSNILGAGASIYSSKDFEKNTSVIKGWGVMPDEFENYFCKELNIEKIDLFDKGILGMIKSFSNKEIEKLIICDTDLSNIIFKGIGNFEEPFTAHWILENNEIKENYFIPFNITTGSGRSNNQFTIVLKPKYI